MASGANGTTNTAEILKTCCVSNRRPNEHPFRPQPETEQHPAAYADERGPAAGVPQGRAGDAGEQRPVEVAPQELTTVPTQTRTSSSVSQRPRPHLSPARAQRAAAPLAALPSGWPVRLLQGTYSRGSNDERRLPRCD